MEASSADFLVLFGLVSYSGWGMMPTHLFGDDTSLTGGIYQPEGSVVSLGSFFGPTSNNYSVFGLLDLFKSFNSD